MYPFYFLIKYVKSFVFPYSVYVEDVNKDYRKSYARGETEGQCWVFSQTCLVVLYILAWMLLAVSVFAFSIQDLVVYTSARNGTTNTTLPDNRTVNCQTDFNHVYNNWFLAFGIAGLLYFFVVVAFSIMTWPCAFSPLLGAIMMFYDNCDTDDYIDDDLRYTTFLYAILDAFAFGWVVYGYTMFLSSSDLKYCDSGVWDTFALQTQYLFWLFIAIAAYAIFLNFVHYNAGLRDYTKIDKYPSRVTMNTANSYRSSPRQDSVIIDEEGLRDLEFDMDEVIPEYLGDPRDVWGMSHSRDKFQASLRQMDADRRADKQRMARMRGYVPNAIDLGKV